jgi:vacuolar-type H+-ATPase subunit E/Vma4
MSRERLTESLLNKSDVRARTIWQEAEQRASRYRREAEESCADRRQEAVTRIESVLKQQLDRLSSRTEKRLRRTRLLAEERFSQQLRRLAVEQLAVLSTEQRSRSLRQLAAELPKLDWRQINVHPADRQQAAKLFAACIIDTDPSLLGGLIAATSDNAIRVNNSLSGRLEQAWPKLCGSVLDALRADRKE